MQRGIGWKASVSGVNLQVIEYLCRSSPFVKRRCRKDIFNQGCSLISFDCLVLFSNKGESMKRKLLAVLSILVIVGMMPGSALAAPKPINYSPVDAGPRIREMPATPEMISPVSQTDLAGEQVAAEAAVNASSTDCITGSKIFLILNDYLGRYQATYFNLMGDSPNSQVWVQANLAWPIGDPRAKPEITCDQVSYMMGQFDNNMYPTETSFFGMPDFLDGTNAYLPSLLGLP